MIRRLFNLGVKPEALLLPKRPDQGKCKMCSLDSLQALLDSLLVRTKNDLSRHKEVRRHCQLHALPTEALRSPVCSDSLDCLHQLQGFLGAACLFWLLQCLASCWPDIVLCSSGLFRNHFLHSAMYLFCIDWQISTISSGAHC